MNGRQLALDLLKEDAKTVFARIVRAVEPGALVSVNSLRDLLDAADIPNPSRGGLFDGACRQGLLEPYRTAEGFDITTASTGTSANRSSVRVYRRTAA